MINKINELKKMIPDPEMITWNDLYKASKFLKENLNIGSVVTLHNMHGEPQMPKGLKGTISGVDDAANIEVNWENHSRLTLDVFLDDFIIE